MSGHAGLRSGRTTEADLVRWRRFSRARLGSHWCSLSISLAKRSVLCARAHHCFGLPDREHNMPRQMHD